MPREHWQILYNSDTDLGTIRYIGDWAAGAAFQQIQFQHGPIGEAGNINGIQNEELIELLIMRLQALDLRMPCDENREAIRALEQAADWLAIRTSKRMTQGIEGTERPHSSGEVQEEAKDE